MKIDDYTPTNLKKMTVRELRKEYMSIKKRVQVQVKELEKEYPDSNALDRIPQLKPYKAYKKNELVYRILEAERWADASYSDVKKIKDIDRKISKTLAQSGIKVRADKVKEFGEYMEKMRALKQDLLYDSRVIALAYANKRRRKGIQNILNLDKSELKNIDDNEYNKLVNSAQSIFEELEDDEGGELPF